MSMYEHASFKGGWGGDLERFLKNDESGIYMKTSIQNCEENSFHIAKLNPLPQFEGHGIVCSKYISTECKYSLGISNKEKIYASLGGKDNRFILGTYVDMTKFIGVCGLAFKNNSSSTITTAIPINSDENITVDFTTKLFNDNGFGIAHKGFLTFDGMKTTKLGLIYSPNICFKYYPSLENSELYFDCEKLKTSNGENNLYKISTGCYITKDILKIGFQLPIIAKQYDTGIGFMPYEGPRVGIEIDGDECGRVKAILSNKKQMLSYSTIIKDKITPTIQIKGSIERTKGNNSFGLSIGIEE